MNARDPVFESALAIRSDIDNGARSALDEVRAEEEFLRHSVEELDRLAPQVAGVALNANGDAARFSDFGLPVLPDSIDGFAGPLAGVLAGLDYAAEQGADSIVTAAADTPFFPQDLVDVLQLAAKMEITAMRASGLIYNIRHSKKYKVEETPLPNRKVKVVSIQGREHCNQSLLRMAIFGVKAA